MVLSVDNYTAARPLFPRLTLVRQIRELAEVTGGTTSAITEAFRLARITINAIGDVSYLTQPDAGILFVGDHRAGVELAPLFSVFGSYGREDVHFFGKPFATGVRLLSSLDGNREGLLPVVPRTLARDRRNIWNRDLRWRILQQQHLPTKDELTRLNAHSIRRATSLLEAGHLVTIFPAGGVMNAATRPWRAGVGTIIKLLYAKNRRDVRIVLFRFDDFSATRVVRSLLVQSYGFTPKPYEITVRLAAIDSMDKLFGDSSRSIEQLDPLQISTRLHEEFIRRFQCGAA
jgi:hypothetical protein